MQSGLATGRESRTQAPGQGGAVRRPLLPWARPGPSRRGWRPADRARGLILCFIYSFQFMTLLFKFTPLFYLIIAHMYLFIQSLFSTGGGIN